MNFCRLSSHPKSATFTALLLSAITGSAELLVHEGFDGYVSGQLQGQTVTGESYGLNGTLATNAGAETYYTFDPVGLTFGALEVSGGSGQYTRLNGEAAFLGFNYSGASYAGTLYSSYLAQVESGVNNASVAGARVSSSATTGTAGAYFQSFLEGNTGTAPTTAYQRTFSSATVAGGTVAQNPVPTSTTFLVIGRYTNVGTPISSTLGLSGTATTYVLTLDQYEDFRLNGGFSDAALDSAIVGTGATGNVFARLSNTHNPGGVETYNFAPGNGVQFSVGNAGLGSNQSVSFDELRYGTTLADVTIPEPSVLTLLGACGVVLGFARKRRR
jgi:hypothetical protein